MTTNVIQMRRALPVWTFAERVRKVRRDAGLNQETFAELLGVRLSTYSAWETGRNTPDLTAVAPTLERVTGVPRTWFLGWNDNAPDPDGTEGDGASHPRESNPRPIHYE